MTPEGYKKIDEALAGIEGVTVSPIPEEGDDLPRVTIEVPTWPAQDEVFGALGKKALLLKDITKLRSGEPGPILSLHARGVSNGRVLIEFNDMAATQDSN